MRFPPQVFVFRGPENIEACGRVIRQHAPEMARHGRLLACRVYEHRPNSTDAQRALIWVINTQVADQCKPGGRSFSPEVWHEQLKRDCLPDETARGAKKWVALPDGTMELGMGTEDLDREEKSAYINAVLAHVAAELGVTVRIIGEEFGN